MKKNRNRTILFNDVEWELIETASKAVGLDGNRNAYIRMTVLNDAKRKVKNETV